MADESQRFDDDEVALVLHRAAELQAGRSMTLAEIETIANEAGIDAALVRRAAAEMRTRVVEPAPMRGGMFGPTILAHERSVPGEVGPVHWDEIVAEIRRRIAVPGTVEELGKELVWSSKRRGGEGRNVRLFVTARRGRTVIRVEERTGALAGGLYGGLLGGLGGAGLAWILPVCIAALGLPILIPVLFAGWLFAVYMLTRTIYRTVLEGRDRELRALADAVATVAGEVALPAGAAQPELPSASGTGAA